MTTLERAVDLEPVVLVPKDIARRRRQEAPLAAMPLDGLIAQGIGLHHAVEPLEAVGRLAQAPAQRRLRRIVRPQ